MASWLGGRLARTCCLVVLSIVPAGERACPGRMTDEMKTREQRRRRMPAVWAVEISIGLLKKKEKRSDDGRGED